MNRNNMGMYLVARYRKITERVQLPFGRRAAAASATYRRCDHFTAKLTAAPVFASPDESPLKNL